MPGSIPDAASLVSPSGAYSPLRAARVVRSRKYGNYVYYQEVELEETGLWCINIQDRIYPLCLVKEVDNAPHEPAHKG